MTNTETLKRHVVYVSRIGDCKLIPNTDQHSRYAGAMRWLGSYFYIAPTRNGERINRQCSNAEAFNNLFRRQRSKCVGINRGHFLPELRALALLASIVISSSATLRSEPCSLL